MSIEIESSDVINLIQQFLEENKLTKTLSVLQEETGLKLNSVSDLDSLINSVNHGHWDIVLKSIKNFKISHRMLIDLYEQVIIELVEMREVSAARAILRTSDIMDFLKKTIPDRYLNLEKLLSKTYFDPNEIYPRGITKDKKRRIIADALKKEVQEIPASRLLVLLGQALKFQQNQGLIPPDAKVDLLSGKVIMKELVAETFPTSLSLTIQFPSPNFPKVISFSNDGQYLVSGSSDGFIEVWNFMTGKLRLDLKYQSLETYMLMSNSITALVFNKDSELLASGDSSGVVKVWKIRTGECVKHLPHAHTQSISCLLFSYERNQLFTGSTDAAIRMHSLKSCSVLKEFSGHTSFITSLIYTQDRTGLISSSSDGTLRIWSIKNSDCLKVIRVEHDNLSGSLGICCVFIHPKLQDSLIVINKSSNIYVLNKNSQVMKVYYNGRQDENGDFVSGGLSPNGNFLYALTQDGKMFCLDFRTGTFVHNMMVHTSLPLSQTHHPYMNLVATCSEDGAINIWK